MRAQAQRRRMARRPASVSGSRSSAARGFTLLEVLLAMVVLALAASLTLPALVRPSGSELRAATGTVVAGLRRARNAAVSAGKQAVMTVDLDQRRFTVSGTGGTRQLPQRISLDLVTARSEIEEGNRGRIRFFPDGSSTGGRVTLSSAERRYHVDVDWLTGQVRVHSGEPGDDTAAADGRVRLGS